MQFGNRRAWFALLAVAGLTLLTGCSTLGFGGPVCGPGDTEIGSIDGNASNVHVKGELTSINETELVVDDGSGTVEILTLSDSVSGKVSTGDCIIARGQASTLDNSSHDALLIPTGGLWEEE